MSSISSSLSGLQSAQSLLDTTAVRIAKAGPSPENSVDLIEAKKLNAANVSAIRVADEMDRNTIDLLA
jgi:flagellar hook protein FlgE